MPYTTSQRARIYYETEGHGPPLVLHHGLAGSLEVWRDLGYTSALGTSSGRDFGYTDALRSNFRLILIDARGHGRSDKPLQPEAYRVEFMAADVVAVLDALRVPRAHFWGYSLGAAVGFALAGTLDERFASFILGGYSPYGVRSEVERKFGEWFSMAMALSLAQGMEGYLAALEKASRPVPPPVRQRLLANDPRALLTMTKTIYRWQGVGQMLTGLKAPCLLYAGTADPWHASLKEAAAHLSRGEFVSLPGEDHFTALRGGEAILSQAQRFLRAVQGDSAPFLRQPAAPARGLKADRG